MTLAGRRVVLGVSGGIASYKACTIARRLSEAGTAVDVVLTSAAAEFVRPVTFEALTGRPVQASLWERGRALTHIHLARDPDLIVVAPATANLLARAAQGLADDLLTALLLASTRPVLVAPAMNDEMFAHAATQSHLDVLRERGWEIVGPAVGPLAEGTSDRPGRMVEPEIVVQHVARALTAPSSALRGKHVVVTAGATREYLDDVRVITNPSSGRMGVALASAAWIRGARVTLVLGPTALPAPHGPEVRRVTTTADLAATVTALLDSTDVLLMAAAPADYRARERWAGKRPRGDGTVTVTLEPTTDVLAAATKGRKAGSVVVGFALETGEGARDRARAKLKRKGADLIVMNRADQSDAGFEVETNRVTLVGPRDATDVPAGTKAEVSEAVLDAVESLL